MLKTTPDNLPVDKDGDIGIRAGSAMVFVRVRDNPPLYRRIGVMSEHETVYGFMKGREFVRMMGRLRGVSDLEAATRDVVTGLQSYDAQRGLRERLRCARCGWTHWNNPTPGLAAVIELVEELQVAAPAPAGGASRMDVLGWSGGPTVIQRILPCPTSLRTSKPRVSR